jgi:XTP/dITP diphosphohydrolase
LKDTKIVLASGNEGKLRELHSILSTLGVELISQRALGVDDADETGLTFVENALIKARHACEVTGLPAIADDSGIEVDALNGEPGIYSARFAAARGTSFANRDEIDAANNALLLERLQGVAPAQRTARFQCIIVLLKHAADPTPLICQGTWEGVILDSAEGTNGFGYDPLFFVPSHNCASALLDPHIKNAISHRGQALEQLRRCWPSHL